MDNIKQLALETIKLNKQAIVFVPSRASAEKTAEELAKLSTSLHPNFEKEVLKVASTPTKQCRRLSHCIRKGVAFHHAGLIQKQKDLIESEFKNGKIKIICATPTLAAGLSLPVFRVIIKSLKRFSGKWGMDWIPVLEYLQMAGRAGRPEYEKFGEAIVIAKNDSEKDEIYERYICGEPEEIYSKLAAEPVLRTYLLSLISSGIIRDEKSMKKFFSETFWAKQYEDMDKLEKIMEKMLSLLDEWQFVNVRGKKDKSSDFISASEIINKNYNHENLLLKPTLIGKRISELYLDPLTAKHILNCIESYHKLNEENKKTFSLLQMISHTLEMRPLLRIKSKEQDKIQEKLIENYDYLLEQEPSAFDLEYNEFMNSIKTTLFFESWINEKDEDYLLEKYDIRPGEIRIKIESADWLLYAAEELSKIKDYKEVSKELRKLRVRVKKGVKEELLHLLKLKGIGRIRARKLYSNGLKGINELKKTDVSTISQLLGTKIAIDVKKQLGQEIKEIPKGTRKGQMSLNKY